jgi:hypothetical protein
LANTGKAGEQWRRPLRNEAPGSGIGTLLTARHPRPAEASGLAIIDRGQWSGASIVGLAAVIV